MFKRLRLKKQRTENPCVGGSIPPSATKNKTLEAIKNRHRLICGRVSNIQCLRALPALICDALFVTLIALVAITWIVGLGLWVFIPDAHADEGTTLERSTDRVQTSAKVQLTKQASGVVACMMPIDDVIAGEWIELRGWVGTTNDSGMPIGVTVEIMKWDAGGWVNLRQPAPLGSELGGGNLTPSQHHWTYTTTADYGTRDYAGRQWFAVMLWAYRKPDPAGYLAIDRCSVRAVRHRP